MPNQISKAESGFDFTKSKSQMLTIAGVRIGFLLIILTITLIFQGFQPGFVNFDVLFPIYMMMTFLFVINALYLLFFEKALQHWQATALLFCIEAAFITALIYYTGINQSIFLFLYLVNIILCGFVFQKRGAFVLALWTSCLMSFLLISGPEIKGQTLYFSISMNNMAFFAVAALSGFLSEQLNFMGSELKVQGQNLRALKNFNQLIIDTMGTGMITIDIDGKILQSNRAAHEILDFSGQKMVGKILNDILQGIMAKISSFTRKEDGRLSERFDWTYFGAIGQDKLILEVVVSALRDENRQLSGYVLTFQDSTKVRRLEFAMRQSEKMAAVGQLAAGIAHEIRNPLASISGSIQLLGSSFSGQQAEEKKLMAIAIREIDRLNNLITEFLEYVRPDVAKDEPVDVNTVAREVMAMVKHNRTLRADIEQVMQLDAKQMISGNKDKFKQALLNIIINSYQAMNETVTPRLEVVTFDLGSSVIVKIKDHGTGMDEAGLRKIFEPFHTTKPKGTGLGLAVTHKIIEGHQGKIFVDSAKGIGTEFTLEFPARGAPSEAGKGVEQTDQLGLADSVPSLDDLSWKKRGNG